ncbi:aminotransferase class V-fold PLP-dependent enzyme [Gudongella oleilytica]|jgi:cysteine desulfurase family protein|uniref:aminotransferase class V-fold PLP-dependent enzyme n=1 Tax=Gudongella oleilytica TaxID=1582259 RepID=UPI002A36E99D|nr:aminotransferase class V-fold PLP-dependent enzyme [Gudongella oleilytica]MDY0257774.1 aminotransferase class V-fold PLP-dependent enzyme [Gudongella oleilytica]
MYYFDNAATSFPKPQKVYDKMLEAMKEYGANPGRSGHKLALRAGREIFNTRQLLSELFGIGDPLDIAFTFNCTESLNIGIQGILKPGDHVVTTSMEHNSVLRPIKALERYGVEHTIVWADEKGRLTREGIEAAIKQNTALIVMTHMSNLLGTIMPISDVGMLARSKGIPFLVDAAQSAGVVSIDVDRDNIDILAFPGHKGLFGPQGTGGIYVRKGISLEPLTYGGTGSASYSMIQPEIMPDMLESGTPNAPGIAALGEGIQFIKETGLMKIRRHEEDLLQHFLEEAKHIEGIKIYGPGNTVEQVGVASFNFRDMDSSHLAYILSEEYEILARPGLHCAPLAHETIGTTEQGAVRFSFGIFNDHNEIENAIKALREISRQI